MTNVTLQSTFQSNSDAFPENFLDRIVEIHWPERSGPIITAGWEWKYEFNFTNGGFFFPAPGMPACQTPITGGPPCYDFIFPDSAAGTFCGWGDIVKVGVDLGGSPPAKVSPSPDFLKVFPVVGHPAASDNISLPPHVYASQAWVQPLIKGAASAAHFELFEDGQPDFGGAFVYRGQTTASGSQGFWGKPIQDYALGYWISQAAADEDAMFPTTCVFRGVYANGWVASGTGSFAPLGGSISASMSGSKEVTLKPPGLPGVPTKKPVVYELYQTRIAFSVNNSITAVVGPVGAIDFSLDYKVKGSATPKIGHNVGP